MARSSVLILIAAALTLPAAAFAQDDFAGQAWNILPPGQSGALPAVPNSTDQLALYDALTPLGGSVTQDDIAKYFKPATFGVTGTPVSTEQPKAGVTIVRDSFGVPHITGTTRSDVFFGAGWATAEDRSLFMEVLRYPARIAALDVPGESALGIATSLQGFTPSKQAEQFLANEAKAFAKLPGSKPILADAQAYIDGINAEYKKTGNTAKPWTINDVEAIAALLGNVFGRGGGDEVGSGALLASLQAKLGKKAGFSVWQDLRRADDPEAPTTTAQRFTYDTPVRSKVGPGAVIPDPPPARASSASLLKAEPARRNMSNALLVGASKSADGHPLFVAGPQLGYYYPEFFSEQDLHGGGVDVRGGALPGVPYVLIGRGKDYVWSATSASSDDTDQFLEKLCGKNKYVYKGKCIRMTRFDAGILKGQNGQRDKHLVYMQTVHGPVQGTVPVHGKKYAVAFDRATRGRDVFSARAIAALNTDAITSAQSFVKTMGLIDFTFNMFYADSKDIAFISVGRLPIRAKGTYPGLPTLGTGKYDWKGFLPLRRHAQAIDPPSGYILNWNNKPAPGWGAADDNFSYGPTFRVQMFTGFPDKSTLPDVVSVMNHAAIMDFRAVYIWPLIRDVLATGPAPDATTQQAADLVTAWGNAGGSRLDRDLDGKIDDPGAAILDAAWPGLADAVMSPVLGNLTSQLDRLQPRDDKANSGGSSYYAGWYGYIDKDLRTLLGRPVNGKFSRAYCGKGDKTACRTALWAALQAAVKQLSATQGPDPAQWRSDATGERIQFAPGVLGQTMRWANRPTFQQVMEFTGHR